MGDGGVDNTQKQIIGVQYLDRVRHEYEETPNRLTEEECRGIGISETSCTVLSGALGPGPDGYLSPGNKVQLKNAGFSQDFITGFAGDDGMKALMNRARWMVTYPARESEEATLEGELDWMSSVDLFQKRPDPVFVSALKHPESHARRRAAKVLLANGQEVKAAIESLVRDLKGDVYQDREKASLALTYVHYNTEEAKKAVVPFLIKLLGDKDKSGSIANVRWNAIRALEEIGGTAVPELVVALKDQNRLIREGASEALAEILPTAGEGANVISSLIHTLRDPDARVRGNAAKAIEKRGPNAKEAVPALIQALRDRDPFVRQRAAEALREIGPEAKAAVPALIRVLKSKKEDGDVRWYAVLALGGIGPEGKAAVPALIEALRDREMKRNAWAPVETLTKIGVVAVPELTRALKDKDPEVREGTATVLSGIGTEAKAAVPALIDLLKDDEREGVRWNAVRALGNIGPAASSAIPSLEAMAQSDPHAGIRKDAADTLFKIRGK